MNKCYDIGSLQAYIDGELDIKERKDLENHIVQCRKCSDALNELIEVDNFVFTKIGSYKEYIEENSNLNIKPNINKQETNKKKGVSCFMIKYRKIAAVACACAVIAFGLTLQPVRAAIADALMIFRAESVKGINITLEDIEKIQQSIESKQPEIDMDKLGKIKMQGGETKVISPEDIDNLDLKVKLPLALADTRPQIRVNEPTSVDFTLNVENVNQTLKTFGAKSLLPKSIDQKSFNISFSSMVNIEYNIGDKFYNIMQTKSPEIKVPSDVNIDEIYNAVVDLPILPGNLQKQLKSIKDWKNTLYIPVFESNMKEVDINGSKGYIVSEQNNQRKFEHSSLIWLRDSVIYTMDANVGEEEILEIAKSMR